MSAWGRYLTFTNDRFRPEADRDLGARSGSAGRRRASRASSRSYLSQLKLSLPLGLSHCVVRSRAPFASFQTRRLSWYGSGASGVSLGRTPCGQSGGQIAVKLANPPVPPFSRGKPIATSAPTGG